MIVSSPEGTFVRPRDAFPARVLPAPEAPDRSPPGIPERIVAAVVRYTRWRDELLAKGLTPEDADRTIRMNAEAEGGLAEAGERINCTAWSELTGIARPILEALVLAAHRRHPAPVASPVALPGPASDEGRWTPPPPATRWPPVEPPPASC